MMFGPHTAKLLRAALATGIDARASRDAGSYLCNYLSWRAIEAVDKSDGLHSAASPCSSLAPAPQEGSVDGVADERMSEAAAIPGMPQHGV